MNPLSPELAKELILRLESLEREAKAIRECLLLGIGAAKAPRPTGEIRWNGKVAKVKK